MRSLKTVPRPWLAVGLVLAAACLAPSIARADTGWRQASETGPVPRLRTAMAFDRGRERLVLFGGRKPWDGRLSEPGWPVYEPLSDTWEWDGEKWHARASDEHPAARFGHTMAYNQALGCVVLFGGYSDEYGYFDDTWVWDGLSWRQMEPLERPGARIKQGMVYDAESSRVLMFGGRGVGLHADLWAWDGETWSLLDTACAVQPEPRTEPCYAPLSTVFSMHHSAVGELIVFGNGYDLEQDESRMEMWRWNGAGWSQLEGVTDTLPFRYFDLAAAYDERRQRLVLFGGVLFEDSNWNEPYRSGDTWEWGENGKWHLIDTDDEAPVPRCGHATAYDAARGQVVVFGGDTDVGFVSDTWVYPVDTGCGCGLGNHGPGTKHLGALIVCLLAALLRSRQPRRLRSGAGRAALALIATLTMACSDDDTANRPRLGGVVFGVSFSYTASAARFPQSDVLAIDLADYPLGCG